MVHIQWGYKTFTQGRHRWLHEKLLSTLVENLGANSFHSTTFVTEGGRSLAETSLLQSTNTNSWSMLVRAKGSRRVFSQQEVSWAGIFCTVRADFPKLD